MKTLCRIAYWTFVGLLTLALLIVVVSTFDTRVWWLDLPSQFRWHELLLFAIVTCALVVWPKRGLFARLIDRISKRSPRAAFPRTLAIVGFVGLIWCGYEASVSSESDDRSSPDRELRVIHFNLGERTGDWQNVLTWLERQRADVIFLQEARPAFERELDASPLAKFIVYRNVRPDSRGTIALVTGNVKLIDAHLDTETFIQTLREMISVTVEQHGTPRTLLSMHMCRPTNATEFAKQSYEIGRLGEWFGAHPTGIAIGDINCAPYNPRLRDVIEAHRLNASTAATWPTPLPSWLSIPIDGLLVDEHSSVSSEAGPDLGSDHRPLIATIVFPS